MDKSMRWLYPFTVGILFGILQTSFFIRLSFALASTFGTFLMVTLAWLAGSMVGLHLSTARYATLKNGLAIAIIPYLVIQALLALFPFQSALWPLYAVLIITSGAFSGIFFARMGSVVKPVRHLFFAENNGFLLGIVLYSLLYLVLPQILLLFVPLLFAVLCLIITPDFASLSVVSNPSDSASTLMEGNAG
jgi:hypothetical protein